MCTSSRGCATSPPASSASTGSHRGRCCGSGRHPRWEKCKGLRACPMGLAGPSIACRPRGGGGLGGFLAGSKFDHVHFGSSLLDSDKVALFRPGFPRGSRCSRSRSGGSAPSRSGIWRFGVDTKARAGRTACLPSTSLRRPSSGKKSGRSRWPGATPRSRHPMQSLPPPTHSSSRGFHTSLRRQHLDGPRVLQSINSLTDLGIHVASPVAPLTLGCCMLVLEGGMFKLCVGRS